MEKFHEKIVGSTTEAILFQSLTISDYNTKPVRGNRDKFEIARVHLK